MTLLPHLAARLFGVPLAIHRPKLDVILSVLGPRVGLADLAAPPAFTPPARPAPTQTPHVAVIPVHGTLVRRTVGLEAESGLTSYMGLAAQLDAALASPEVAAILLDIDSPGGESGGVFDLADRIRAASQIKPVWAVANDMAFSAAYALASAANKVFVSRTGGVGSIGVIAMHVDQSGKDAQDGVRYTAVFAGAARTISTRTSRSPTPRMRCSRPRWIASTACSSRRWPATAGWSRPPCATPRPDCSSARPRSPWAWPMPSAPSTTHWPNCLHPFLPTRLRRPWPRGRAFPATTPRSL
jgi:hypothetical protein